MEKVTKSKYEILSSALNDKKSPLFLSKNVKRIATFLKKRGFDIDEKTIKSFLAEKKSAPIVIKNKSERKIREISRPFNGPQQFFQLCHCDLIVLSRHRAYGGSEKYILVFVDGLSSYTFLEASNSTKSKDIIAAFERIFARSDYLPEKLKTLCCDFGIEFTSNAAKSFFAQHGIKLSLVKKRLDRFSRGSTIVETTNRIVRLKLEAYIADFGLAPLAEMLKHVENSLNNEGRKMFNDFSSKQMLLHDPKYVSMLKASYRLKSRKSLKRHIENPVILSIYSIVRIRKNVSKQKLGTKESYGSLSDSMYVVLSKKDHDFVSYYELGDLYTLTPVTTATFAYHELIKVDISYEKARYVDCINTGTVVKMHADKVEFKPNHCPYVYIGPKKMFK